MLDISEWGGLPDYKQSCRKTEATARGFEPLRAEPNGFLVHHLSHSVTLSLTVFHFVCIFCSFRFYTDPLIYTNLEPLEGQGFLLKDSLLVFFLQLAEFSTRVLTCFINCLFPKTPRGLEPLQAEPNGFPGQSGFDMLIVYT